MSLAATVTWELRTGGSDSNGGGFDSAVSGAGTDYSQQNSAQATGTNLTVDATTNTHVLPDGYSPSSSTDPGNVIQITSGTGFTTGFYEIMSVSSGKWVLDRSPAATGTSGGHWSFGGALTSFSKTAGAMVSGNTCFVQNGTFTVSSNVVLPSGSSTSACKFVGYNTTRTLLNTDSKTTINAGANSITVFNFSGNIIFYNFDMEGNSKTGCTAIYLNNDGGVVIQNCKINAFKVGINGGSASTGASTIVAGCEIVLSTEGSAMGIEECNALRVIGCYIHGGTGSSCSGISDGGFSCIYGCIITAATGTGGTGIQIGVGSIVVHSIVSGSGQDGIHTATASNWIVLNSIIANCGRYGINYSTSGNTPDFVLAINNAFYNNTTANLSGNTTSNSQGNIALTVNPFNNSSGGDYSLNNTASGGVLLRAAGYPSAITGTSTTDYPDIGLRPNIVPGANNWAY